MDDVVQFVRGLSPQPEALTQLQATVGDLARRISDWNRDLARLAPRTAARKAERLSTVIDGVFGQAHLLDERLRAVEGKSLGWPDLDLAAAALRNLIRVAGQLASDFFYTRFPAETDAAADQVRSALKSASKLRPGAEDAWLRSVMAAVANFYRSFEAMKLWGHWPKWKFVDEQAVRSRLRPPLDRCKFYSSGLELQRHAPLGSVLHAMRQLLSELAQQAGIGSFVPPSGYCWWGPEPEARSPFLFWIPADHRKQGPSMWPRDRWVKILMGETTRFPSLDDGAASHLNELAWIIDGLREDAEHEIERLSGVADPSLEHAVAFASSGAEVPFAIWLQQQGYDVKVTNALLNSTDFDAVGRGGLNVVGNDDDDSGQPPDDVRDRPPEGTPQ